MSASRMPGAAGMSNPTSRAALASCIAFIGCCSSLRKFRSRISGSISAGAAVARRLQASTSLVLTMVISDVAELYHDFDAPRTRTLTAILTNVTVIVMPFQYVKPHGAQPDIVVSENE